MLWLWCIELDRLSIFIQHWGEELPRRPTTRTGRQEDTNKQVAYYIIVIQDLPKSDRLAKENYNTYTSRIIP